MANGLGARCKLSWSLDFGRVPGPSGGAGVGLPPVSLPAVGAGRKTDGRASSSLSFGRARQPDRRGRMPASVLTHIFATTKTIAPIPCAVKDYRVPTYPHEIEVSPEPFSKYCKSMPKPIKNKKGGHRPPIFSSLDLKNFTRARAFDVPFR